MNPKINEILVVAGEHSGDSLGSELISELKKRNSQINFIGIGGAQMISEGIESLYDIEEMNVIGFTGALLKYRKLKNIANKLVKICLNKNIKNCILIDYPGFNLELASMLKESIPDIKIIFYVSPQIWAWRFNRIFKIKKNIDLMLLLFPFEKKIYDNYKINNVVVGHPLVNKMQESFNNGFSIEKDPNLFYITLMPGSRTGEIRRLLTVLLDSAKLIQEKFKNVHFLIPGINEKESQYIIDSIQNTIKNNPDLRITYHFENSARCIEASEMVVLASGTATLEVAYFKKPMVIIYKNSFITHFIGKKLLLLPYVGLVNILSEKFICKEFLQDECNSKNIFIESENILLNKNYREEMIDNLEKVKNGLGKGDSSKIAAEAILKLISFY